MIEDLSEDLTRPLSLKARRIGNVCASGPLGRVFGPSSCRRPGASVLYRLFHLLFCVFSIDFWKHCGEVSSPIPADMGQQMCPKRKMCLFGNERFVLARAHISRFRGSKIDEKGVPKTMRNMIGFVIEKRLEHGLKKRPMDTQKATIHEHRQTSNICTKTWDAGHAGHAW